MKTSRRASPKHSTKFPMQIVCVMLAFLFVVVCLSPAKCAPEKKGWVSLGYSTYIQRTPDWNWLREQSSGGRVIARLKPVKGQIRGIIIPVFDSGQCFFDTSIAPFQGRMPHAKENELALKSLLVASQRQGIPVYLGFNVLRWSKPTQQNGEKAVNPNTPPIFDQLPSWREASRDGLNVSSTEPLFASPFNAEVRERFCDLVKEAAKRFPEASGAVFDLSLSSHEILGYSEGSRAASIVGAGVDPVDLRSLRGNVDDVINTPTLRWITWRRASFRKFLGQIKSAYQSPNTKRKFFVSGVVDYYADQQFNHLRSTQDWINWSIDGIAEGVILEGRWLSRFKDKEDVLNYRQDISNKAKSDVRIVQMILGDSLIKGSSIYKDYRAINSGMSTTSEQELAFFVEDARGIDSVVKLLDGSFAEEEPNFPKVNEIFPDFILADSQGKKWNSKSLRGSNYALLIGSAKSFSNLSESTIDEISSVSKSKGVQTFFVSAKPVINEKSTIVNLVDTNREITSESQSNMSVIAVDKVGVVRGAEKGSLVKLLGFMSSKTGQITPALSVGDMAPEFVMTGMDGRTFKITDYRGMKNLLLTFFPRCFTGGCAGQLASLKNEQALFESKDIQIVAVSVDPADIQVAFARSLGIEFQFIPDTERRISYLYGATQDFTSLAGRQSVFIDKQGVVRFIDRQVRTGTHGKDVMKKLESIVLP